MKPSWRCQVRQGRNHRASQDKKGAGGVRGQAWAQMKALPVGALQTAHPISTFFPGAEVRAGSQTSEEPMPLGCGVKYSLTLLFLEEAVYMHWVHLLCVTNKLKA